MKIYLICPVRNSAEDEKYFLDRHVAFLENSGHKVHYPPRDVNQNEAVGLKLLSEHKKAMKESNIARIFYNTTSLGSCFDLGMVIMNKTPLQVIRNQKRDHLNLIQRLIDEYSGRRTSISNFFNQTMKRRDELLTRNFVAYRKWDSQNPFMLLDLGMIFMAGIPLKLVEGHGVKQTTDKGGKLVKSFDNVVLKLNEIYGGDLPADYH